MPGPADGQTIPIGANLFRKLHFPLQIFERLRTAFSRLGNAQLIARRHRLQTQIVEQSTSGRRRVLLRELADLHQVRLDRANARLRPAFHGRLEIEAIGRRLVHAHDQPARSRCLRRSRRLGDGRSRNGSGQKLSAIQFVHGAEDITARPTISTGSRWQLAGVPRSATCR
jgi:hypothetical protein